MKVSTEDLEQISSGSNSCIYRLKTKEAGEELVFKIVPAESTKESQHLWNEYQFLSALSHRNIICPILFKTNLQFKGTENHVMAMEYASRGCLLDVIKKGGMTVAEARFVFAELVAAVHYLHERNIAHRDLKLENVLVFETDGEVRFKLADFGFAQWTVQNSSPSLSTSASTQESSEPSDSSCPSKQKLSRGVKGTKRGYMAPEIHNSLSQKQGYKTKNTDIFSLGVMLFAIIFRKLPFEYATKDNQIYKMLWQNDWEGFCKHHSKDFMKKEIEDKDLEIQQLKQLLEKMLCRDPGNRWRIQDVLESSWMQGKKSQPK